MTSSGEYKKTDHQKEEIKKENRSYNKNVESDVMVGCNEYNYV